MIFQVETGIYCLGLIGIGEILDLYWGYAL